MKRQKIKVSLGLLFIKCLFYVLIMSNVEVVTLSEKGQIVLPKKVRREVGLSKGNKMLLVEKNGKITLIKVNEIMQKEFSTLLASEKSLAKDWLSKEEEKAWKNL